MTLETRAQVAVHVRRSLDTYVFSPPCKRALIAGRREDKLIGLELTLDIGKMLQSMPKRRWLFHVRRPLCHLHDLPPCSRGLAVEVSTHYRQEAPGT